MAELTEIRVHRQAWWSVGFEAAGPVRLRRGALEHAAGLVSARALPPEVRFGLENSQSCAHWLASAQPGCRGHNPRVKPLITPAAGSS